MVSNEPEEVDFDYRDFPIRDFASENALCSALGVVLRRTICSISHCPTCISAFTGDGKSLLPHCLIELKTSYSGGNEPLIYPSLVAYTMFVRIFENYFLANWEKLKSPEAHDQFLSAVYEDLTTQYPDVPTCHLRMVLQRFLKFRTIFKAGGLNRQVVESNKRRVRNDAQASKSMVGYYVNK